MTILPRRAIDAMTAVTCSNVIVGTHRAGFAVGEDGSEAGGGSVWSDQLQLGEGPCSRLKATGLPVIASSRTWSLMGRSSFTVTCCSFPCLVQTPSSSLPLTAADSTTLSGVSNASTFGLLSQAR